MWGWACYLSVTGISHIVETLRVSRTETFCVSETWEPEWGSNRDLRLSKQAALTTAPGCNQTCRRGLKVDILLAHHLRRSPIRTKQYWANACCLLGTLAKANVSVLGRHTDGVDGFCIVCFKRRGFIWHINWDAKEMFDFCFFNHHYITIGPFEWLFSSSTFFRQKGQRSKVIQQKFDGNFFRLVSSTTEKIKQPIE